MKKVIVGLFMCMFLIGMVFAAGNGVHEPGTGIENPELKEAGQGTGQGLENGVKSQQRVVAGNYNGENGQQMKIQKQSNNRIRLEVKGVGVDCDCNMTQERVQNKTRLNVKLNNGRNAEIKIMPNTASETALKRLRLKNCVEEEGCNIELKEVGKGEGARLAYEMKTQKQAKVFGLFKAKMNVQAQVDAESGEIVRVKKPWWAFLASESEE